ncbi:MAG: HAMP domain-containing sensor histidine kinase, partial [Bacteroidota bacterium]
ISQAYLKNEDLDSAYSFAQQGIGLAHSLDNKAPLRDLEHTSALIFNAMGDYRKAYYHESRYAHLNDSLLMAEKEIEIEALENRFFSSQKQNELDLLNERQALQDAKLRKARLINYGMVGLAIFVLIVAGLLYMNNRLKRRANLILLAQKNEVRRQRDELEQSNHHLNKINHEMDSFMYRVSHDLRSPLTSVMGLISLASQENDTTRRDHYLQLMQKSLNKLDGFIQDIIDVTRNNRQDVKYVEINVKTLVKEYFDQYKYHDGRTDIVCEYENKGQAYLINDEYRLGVILSNLINNAIRFSTQYREDTVVKVSSHIDAERATIQVRDNGPGISKEHQEKIFDMFFRSDNLSGGSGLGLYIVRETVEKLGGNIRVASEVRHGSTFIIELPNQKMGTEDQSPSINLEQVLNA